MGMPFKKSGLSRPGKSRFGSCQICPSSCQFCTKRSFSSEKLQHIHRRHLQCPELLQLAQGDLQKDQLAHTQVHVPWKMRCERKMCRSPDSSNKKAEMPFKKIGLSRPGKSRS